jgi:serine/threonine-protein kinase
MTRGPQDWQPPTETTTAARQFAGIDLEDFQWARQRAKQLAWVWVSAVLILTGAAAAAAWTVGSNRGGLI